VKKNCGFVENNTTYLQVETEDAVRYCCNEQRSIVELMMCVAEVLMVLLLL